MQEEVQRSMHWILVILMFVLLYTWTKEMLF